MNKPYTAELEAQIKAWSREQQPGKRFAHTERVVETVALLAEKWSPEDVLVCRIAAWIHDAAKKYADADLLNMAQARGLPVTPFERQTPMLLHGIVAYALAAELFELDDERLLTACAYHTSGSAAMSLIDKLLFLADKIEPGRDFPGVDKIRAAAAQDIEWALWAFVDGNIRYLMDRMKPIDPRQIEFYNVLLVKVKEKTGTSAGVLSHEQRDASG